MTRRVGRVIATPAVRERDAVSVANLPSPQIAGTTERMARRKRTPERSTLVRSMTPAFSRRQRGGDGSPDDADAPASSPETAAGAPEPSSSSTEPTVTEGKPLALASDAETQPIATRQDPPDLPDITPPDPRAEPWPDATPPPMAPVVASEPVRPRTSTVAMPVVADLGRPPEMPTTVAPPPLVLGEVENPTHMPGPRQIPAGAPDDPAPAPGAVPPGDSRSLRRDDEFALIYRVGTCVITRTGRLGTRGQWRVVEYPTSAAASNSYAKECSRFVSDGFSDYRE
jgi:hypothetical protein